MEILKLIIIPFTGALVTVSVFLIQNRQMKISRALQYHDQYYNTDLYYNVISPSQEIIKFLNCRTDTILKKKNRMQLDIF